MATFDHLSIGRSAMRAFRLGMNIAGYNVANANTEGFSRRRIELGTMNVVAVRNGLVGSGVDVTSVGRVRDRFLDFAARREVGRMGADSSRAEVLSAVEPMIGEVTAAAVPNALTDLFDAFETLAGQADSAAARADVIARAKDLASAFQRTYTQFTESRRNADVRVIESIDRANEIVGELRQMNVDIIALEAGGAEASDLRDQRDMLLDELSQIVPTHVIEQENGQISVFLEGSGDTLLATVSVRRLGKSVDSDGMTHVIVDRGGEMADVTGVLRGGELGGYLKVRDEDLVRYRDNLDTLASNVITEVNAQHQAGYDLDGVAGLALFLPDPPGSHPAAGIFVNPAILADTNRIAASGQPNEPGNNVNARSILALRDRQLAGLGNRTLGDYSAEIVAEIGRDVKTSTTALEAGQVIVDSIDSRRAQMSGVSLDEEAADLVRWQQSFQAAARFMQSANEVIDTVLDTLSR
jgi:flagellar hook-associated protein 1 FlgK